MEIYLRQGPSLELWGKYENESDSGTDHVLSIHCEFWPNEAMEWSHRSRNFDWPTSLDISSIVKFGFHLVPVGHPHSDMQETEWRISFSLAERALVWSFNHVQMQCYAIMKIILKEFIKVSCSPQNQVLCSYFIKTFLFWKYEETEVNFWHADNFRECIKYILSEFSKCVREGVLKHYFIPRFNLLSVKLTRAAQVELVHLLDIIIESDISILKECRTFQNIWSDFLQIDQNRSNVLCNLKRRNMLNIDKCIIQVIGALECQLLLFQGTHFLCKAISETLTVFCKTRFKTIVLRKYIFMHIRSILRNNCGLGNKGVYQIRQMAQNETLSFDVSTCKLWCGILLYIRKDFQSTLDIVNKVLSNIPPFALHELQEGHEREQLYVDMFLDSDTTITQRARKAWMSRMLFTKDMSDSLPLGIQIELYFCDHVLFLSPFTCAYYLQFLCYHEMCQYNNRDRALQQLFEVSYNPEQSGNWYTSANIPGHCMLLAGKRAQVQYVFTIHIKD